MDAFFASVEVLDDPTLVGRPVIVGGAGPRGVVAACTYEARMFGVHSAMPSTVARRLCPGAVFLQGRFHRYIEESAKLHAVFEEVTPLVEGISLDEAFLDVTGSVRLLGPGTQIARSIRATVLDRMGLTCSVGIGRSKLIAKLASKAAKPVADRRGIRPGPGVVVVEPAEELGFLGPLPIRALWGVGPVTAKRLDGLGIRTVGDLAALPARTLVHHVGTAQGELLAELARGVDTRPVVAARQAKSIGHEETFPADLWDPITLRRHVSRMVDASVVNLRASGLGARTVTVKVRFGDFTMVTRSHSTSSPLDSVSAVETVAAGLFESVDLSKGVRLLGVSLSGLSPMASETQLVLDLGVDDGAGVQADSADQRMAQVDEVARALQRQRAEITEAVDGIRARFGRSAVGMASLVGPDGLRTRDRGEAQWGPEQPAAGGGDGRVAEPDG
jgi:DNA polymerase-4